VRPAAGDENVAEDHQPLTILANLVYVRDAAAVVGHPPGVG
jgi:hypothetical protein